MLKELVMYVLYVYLGIGIVSLAPIAIEWYIGLFTKE